MRREDRTGAGRRGGGRNRAGGRARGVGTRKPKKQGLLESVGISPAWTRRLGNWALAGMTCAVIVAAVLAFRLPQLAGLAFGEGVGGAGFTLRRVEITGAQRVSRLAIYNVAFDQDSMAMPLVDLAATRARLMRFGWIREARVSRRLPDTLVIDIVERQPVAIWQNNRQLSLIDADGVVLEPVPARGDAGSAAGDRPRRQSPYRRPRQPCCRRRRACGRRSPARPGSASAAGTSASRAANCSPCPRATTRRAAPSSASR